MDTLKIIKIGGNIIDDDNALSMFLKQFARLTGPKILVHGGGKLATKLAQKMNIPVEIQDGRRITNSDTLDVITMVYAGKINKAIIAQLQAHKCNSIGFSGADGNSIVSVKRSSQPLDYGLVGDVKKVNTDILHVLLSHKITPIFCAITHDEKGQLLNTNADTIASELAISFAKQFKTELFYCFEKHGVLKDILDDNSVIENINTATYQNLKKEGIITDGMIPKINNCFHAINNNVERVFIGKPEMLFETNTTYTTIQK